MKFNIEIPKFLSHLKTDKRGYPIPYFVMMKNGEPDFRYSDERKVKEVITRKLCSICAKKLNDNIYFINGPIGHKNRVTTEPPLHRGCAEFALRACPHLYYEKAERRSDESIDPNPYILRNKPPVIYLVKAIKYKVQEDNGRLYMHYYPIKERVFAYVDGELIELDTNHPI